MKFSTREDVAAPIEAVFAAVSDFKSFEHGALRRGAKVNRTDNLPNPGPGMKWETRFSFRNRQRDADLELVQFDAPDALRLAISSPGFEVNLLIDLIALSRNRTRMEFTARIKPNTLTARLAVQAMKLKHSNLTNRFHQQIAKFAGTIEDRNEKTQKTVSLHGSVAGY